MNNLLNDLENRLAALPVKTVLQLPDGKRLGTEPADVRMIMRSPAAYLALLQGRVGDLASAVVEGWMELEGNMHDVIAVGRGLLQADPTATSEQDSHWWSKTLHRARSLALHTLERDAEQIHFHYDLSDDFFALWLDPLRVYSCAYYRDPTMTLVQAQEAKLDHICRKLSLQPGERMLDVGCGWGGLITWAARHYGVKAKGITLSRNQHSYVTELIAREGLQTQVEVALCDYREVTDEPFDKLASVGMFEHVGRANLPQYFQTMYQLLQPGGMALIHGITAGGTTNAQLGAGMGDFIEKYIFPGGELVHISTVLQDMAQASLEMVDAENLRPHYARTLWAWSDNLEARLDEAHAVLAKQWNLEKAQRVIKAYRLYLAGCAMGFEEGWMALHQVLCVRRDGNVQRGPIRGAQSGYPFQRGYMYGARNSVP
ncbi:MAG: class I SAM-dependent methyltransferase [Comamonas sp.]|nr:class I SAM-dependent methyltransferase [Comamonas sp.]